MWHHSLISPSRRRLEGRNAFLHLDLFSSPTAEKISNADFTGTRDPIEVRWNFIAIYWKISEWYQTAMYIEL